MIICITITITITIIVTIVIIITITSTILGVRFSPSSLWCRPKRKSEDNRQGPAGAPAAQMLLLS